MRVGRGWIPCNGGAIGSLGFGQIAGFLQRMPKLEVRLGVVRLIGDRIAIGCFRGGAMAALLQRMTVLYPDRRVARLTVERDAIKAGGGFPLSRLAGAVGAADDRRLAAVIAMEQRHRVLLD